MLSSWVITRELFWDDLFWNRRRFRTCSQHFRTQPDPHKTNFPKDSFPFSSPIPRNSAVSPCSKRRRLATFHLPPRRRIEATSPNSIRPSRLRFPNRLRGAKCLGSRKSAGGEHCPCSRGGSGSTDGVSRLASRRPRRFLFASFAMLGTGLNIQFAPTAP